MANDHRPLVAAQRRERMRARLVQAAFELAAGSGLEAVTIDAVVAQAEVARGTFYKYFDSPHTLVQEVGQAVSHALIEAMHPVVGELSDPAERIAVGVRVVLLMGRRVPALAGFLVYSGWPANELTPLFYRAVGSSLDEGMQSGRLSRMPSALAISILVGTLIGALKAELSQAQDEDFPSQVATAVLRGLGVPQALAQELAYESLEFDLRLADQALERLMA